MNLINIKTVFRLKSLIIIKLKGGLGNQIYILLAAKYIEEKYNARVLIDNNTGFVRDTIYKRNSHFYKSENLDNIFINNMISIILMVIIKFKKSISMLTKKDHNNFYTPMKKSSDFPSFDTINKNFITYLDGYFHNNNILSTINKNYYQKIYIFLREKCSNKFDSYISKYINSKSAIIHIRTYHDDISSADNTSKDYYMKAIRYLITNKISNFLIISENESYLTREVIEICESYNLNYSIRIRKNIYDDFCIMINAENIIITNSTLSSGAALISSSLNEYKYNKKKIIFPKNRIVGDVSIWDPYFMALPGWIGI